MTQITITSRYNIPAALAQIGLIKIDSKDNMKGIRNVSSRPRQANWNGMKFTEMVISLSDDALNTLHSTAEGFGIEIQ